MSTASQPQVAREDPDQDWQPNNRPQSTVARNFMSELDDLFGLSAGVDSLDKNVSDKKEAVTQNAKELEALEAKLRETEERLKHAKTSPPRKESQRTPAPGSLQPKAQGDSDRPRTGQSNGGKA